MLFSTAITTVLDIPAVYSGGSLKIYAPTPENPFIGTYLDGGVGQYYAADSFAFALMANVPVILLSSTLLKTKWEKTLCFCVMLFVVIGSFVSCVRAAWLALALIFLIWMIVQKRWKLMVISAVCCTIVLTSSIFVNPLRQAYQKISFEVESISNRELPLQSFGGRPKMLLIIGTSYMNSPILHQVIGNNQLYSMVVSRMGHDPHNDFLYILLKMGLVGICVTLYLYVKMGINLFQVWRKIETFYVRNLALTAILALLNMFIPSLTRTGLMNPNFEWVFWSFAMLTFFNASGTLSEPPEFTYERETSNQLSY